MSKQPDQLTQDVNLPTEATQPGVGSVQISGNILRLIWVFTTLLGLVFTMLGVIPNYQRLLAEAAVLGTGHVISPGLYAGLTMGLSLVLLITYMIMAVIVYVRQQENWLALLVSLALVGVGTAATDYPDAFLQLHPGYFISVDLLRSMSQGLPVIVLFVLPNGRVWPRWTRWAAVVQLVWTLVRPFLYLTPLHPRFWDPGLTAIWFAVWMGGGIWLQFYRNRHVSTPEERQQAKWLILGISISTLSFVLLSVAIALFPQFQIPNTPENVLWTLGEYTIFVLFSLPAPFGMAFAIMRFRLWNVDYIINKSIVYAMMTALAAIFVILLGLLLPIWFRNLTGGTISLLALAVTFLVLGLTFNPLRQGLQRFVDRQFYDIRIDYEKQEKARREIDDILAESPTLHLEEFGPLELIGRGGMAEIYRTTHTDYENPIALKVLSSALARTPEILKRFERETRLMMDFDHPNIIKVYDHGLADGLHYLLMEYVDGEPLSDVIAEIGRLQLDDVLTLTKDVTSALGYIHGRGIVHRDMKPSNILIKKGGAIKQAIVSDFGIARVVDEPNQTDDAGLVGTFSYMSPEQIRNDEVGPQADIYSLGVTLFEVLTGSLPFKHGSPGAMLIAHLQQPAPDPRKFAPDLPPQVAATLMRAMAKTPDQRFDTVQDLYVSLSG